MLILGGVYHLRGTFIKRGVKKKEAFIRGFREVSKFLKFRHTLGRKVKMLAKKVDKLTLILFLDVPLRCMSAVW